MLTTSTAATLIDRSFQAESQAMDRLVRTGVLRQVGVGRHHRAFEASELIEAFTALERQLASPGGDTRSSAPARHVPRPRGAVEKAGCIAQRPPRHDSFRAPDRALYSEPAPLLPAPPRVARHRVPPVRHLDAGRRELAVRQGAKARARGAQLQLVQGDAADGGLHAQLPGQGRRHLELGGVTRPDAVVQPVRRRRPQ